MEHAYIESFNDCFRGDCLFLIRAYARQVIENWRNEYKIERSHRSFFGGLTPEQFAKGRLTDWSVWPLTEEFRKGAPNMVESNRGFIVQWTPLGGILAERPTTAAGSSRGPAANQ